MGGKILGVYGVGVWCWVCRVREPWVREMAVCMSVAAVCDGCGPSPAVVLLIRGFYMVQCVCMKERNVRERRERSSESLSVRERADRLGVSVRDNGDACAWPSPPLSPFVLCPPPLPDVNQCCGLFFSMVGVCILPV